MIRRIVLSLTVVFLCSSVVPEADAFIFRLFRRRTKSAPTVSVQISGNTQQITLAKARIQANRGGRCFHPGGSMGNGNYEGVGSGTSASMALSNCCRPRGNHTCIGQSVVQGGNGRYYACRIYQTKRR